MVNRETSPVVVMNTRYSLIRKFGNKAVPILKHVLPSLAVGYAAGKYGVKKIANEVVDAVKYVGRVTSAVKDVITNTPYKTSQPSSSSSTVTTKGVPGPTPTPIPSNFPSNKRTANRSDK